MSQTYRVAIFDSEESESKAPEAYKDYLESDFDVDIVRDLDYLETRMDDYMAIGLHWTAMVFSGKDESEFYERIENSSATPFIFSGGQEERIENAIDRPVNFFKKPCYDKIRGFLEGERDARDNDKD